MSMSPRAQRANLLSPRDKMTNSFLQLSMKGSMDAYTFWENHRALTNMRQSLIRQSFEATRQASSSSGSSRRPNSARDSSLSPRRLTPRSGLALDGLPANRLDAYPRPPRASSARGSRTANKFAAPTSSAASKLAHTLDPDDAEAPAMAQQAARLAVPSQAAPVPSGLTHRLPAGVTMSELQAAHQVIKDHLLSKHGNYQRAFLSIDKDHDKFITKQELDWALFDLNLDGIRKPVVAGLVQLVDIYDDDGTDEIDIKYEEFARFLSVDNVLHLVPGNPGYVPPPSDPYRNSGGDKYRRPAAMVEFKASGTVTRDELRRAHMTIRDSLFTKYGGFGKAFRFMDEDASGYISRAEFGEALFRLNLASIRRPVIEAMLDIVDTDDDGGGAGADIQYREYAKYMACEDITDMATPEQLAYACGELTAPPKPKREKGVPQAKEKLPPPLRRGTKGRQRAGPKSLPPSGYFATGPQASPRVAKWMEETGKTAWLKAKNEADAAMREGVAEATRALAASALAKAEAPVDVPLASREEMDKVSDKALKRVQITVKQKFRDKFRLLTDAFKHVDKDRTGSITRDELSFTVFEELNLRTISRAEFERLLDLMDVNKDGTIGYTEFAAALSVDEAEQAMGLALAHNVDLKKTKLRTDIGMTHVRM